MLKRKPYEDNLYFCKQCHKWIKYNDFDFKINWVCKECSDKIELQK